MAKISRAFLQSATSSSAPFLYQTRTLAPLSQSLCRYPPINRLQRQYSGSNAPENDEPFKDGSAARRSQSPKNSSEISPNSTTNDRPAHRRSFLRRRAEEVAPKIESTEPAPSSRPLQTITPAEKMIFADLLKQLKKEQPAAKTTKPSRASMRRPKPENVNDLIALFDDIFDKSEKEAAEKKKKQENEKEKAASAARGDFQKKPFDIPGGSGKIRYSDLGFSAIASKANPDFEITISDAVDIVIKRESKRIEDELFKAIEDGRGDMGLWEECQEHIFGMLRHLEEPTQTLSEKIADGSSSSGTMDGKDKPVLPLGPLNIPAVVPITPVLAKLYPKTLLVAFRLLNTHFPESQLIGQFRSTIKNQGRTSSVLGTSSALCDEMIYFHWHGCNDLPAVIGLLHDMDLHGLSPSPKSHRLLKDIVRQRFRDLDSVRQSETGMASFWQLPPNQTAFEELSGPGGWLDRLDEHARRESAVPFTSE